MLRLIDRLEEVLIATLIAAATLIIFASVAIAIPLVCLPMLLPGSDPWVWRGCRRR